MLVINRNNVPEFLFLELLSVSPIAIILGNILPPVGVKIHYALFGVVFLLSMVILMKIVDKKWLIYTSILFFAIQFTLLKWDVKSFIDFFFGPFVFSSLTAILFGKKLEDWLLKKYVKRFFLLCMVPIFIAILQFFQIVPIEFLNAKYTNFFVFSGLRIPRPNGFLYHGSELAIIIFFVGARKIFSSSKEAIPYLIFTLFCAATTMYKSITMTLFLLLIYFVLFLDKEIFYRFRLISKRRLFAYFSVVATIAGFYIYRYFARIKALTGYIFPEQFLTGRGAIWNIYLEGIKDFTLWNYLFGTGLGSEFEIFGRYATPELFYPLKIDPVLHVWYGTHNSLLGIFINGGLVGIFLIALIFYITLREIQIRFQPISEKRFFFVLFILPVITFGITIPVFEMAIYWPLLGFTLYVWNYSKYGFKTEEGV